MEDGRRERNTDLISRETKGKREEDTPKKRWRYIYKNKNRNYIENIK